MKLKNWRFVMWFKFYYLISFFLLLFQMNPLLAQNRMGSINEYSSETECRKYFQDNILSLDPIEGIYQVDNFSLEVNMYRNFPIQKRDSEKIIIYKDNKGVFRTNKNITINRIGETSFYNYIVNWNKANAGITTNRFSFDGYSFEVKHEVPRKIVNQMLSQAYVNADTKIFLISNFIKEYPTFSMYQDAINRSKVISTQPNEWSGTGFALKDGYIVTNYHVVEDAKKINIKGVGGDFSINYNAELIAKDKYNDLAILQISDNRFNGFGTIPYSVKTSVSDVGEEIFVLGYPLTSTMGDEIKLSTGIISSKSGFQGDISLYQISAPIQPGNSGGPLFDNNGNLIGIVSAKHKNAENVGYAIKTSYMRNLIESTVSEHILPATNKISSLPLTGKVKNLKNFVFIISCSD